MYYIGVDGCHYGWLAVILAGNGWQIDVSRDIFELWKKHHDAELILIDIPIGLRDSGLAERLCDLEARKYIGKRHSSVFRVPCRSAVYANKDEASRINYQKTGKCIGEQSKGIIRKIREVDELLCKYPEARLCISETHPEVCFTAFNGGKPMEHSKKSKAKAGFSERRQILLRVHPRTDEIIDYVLANLEKFPRKDVAKDDILDALAAAITASKKEQGLKSIPEAPEVDARGLPMQILYWTNPQSPLLKSDWKQAL